MTRVNVDMDVNLLISIVQRFFPRNHQAEHSKRTDAIEVLCPTGECGRVWVFPTDQTLDTTDVAKAARRAGELHRKQYI
nr:MAG TPA: hypothetical protein [Caudoviricetes sp.]